MDISSLLIDQDASIKQTLVVLNKNEEKIALVVNKKKILIGTVTDGDIRRGILDGHNLETKCKDVMNKSFFSATNEISEFEAIEIMKKNDLKQLPILNEKGVPKNLILKDKKLKDSKKKNKVFIMAGGEGKRLYPLTKNCPKPMLKIGGKPMLENIINQFKLHGFDNFYISVNYLKNTIIDYFKDGSNFDVKIRYIEEKSKLGTAGSLSLISEKLYEPIIVANADVITSIDYTNLLEYHVLNKNFVTVCIRKYISTVPFGVIKTKDNIVTDLVEKPSKSFNINAGIYILDPKALLYLVKNNNIDIPEYLLNLIKKGKKVSVFPVHEEWQDIGVKKIYEEFKNRNF